MAGPRSPEDEIRELERQSQELAKDLETLVQTENPVDLRAVNPVQRKPDRSAVHGEGPVMDDTPQDVSVRVVVSDDQMMAHLFLYPPPGKSKPAKAEDVVKAVKAKGVVYGLDGAAVAGAVETYNNGFKAVMQVLIAKGTVPQDGRHGEFQPSGTWVSSSDFSAEHPEYQLPAETGPTKYLKAEAGPIGFWIRETKGLPGTSVVGRRLNAQPGKVLLKFGPGLKVEDAGAKSQVKLLKSGALAWDEKTVRVLPEPRVTAVTKPAETGEVAEGEKPDAPVEKPPVYSFAVAENGMAVWLTIRPDEGKPGRAQTKDILAQLRNQGIKVGIDAEAIGQAVETYNAQPALMEKILVAQGAYAEDGGDAVVSQEIALLSRADFHQAHPEILMPEPVGEEFYAVVQLRDTIARIGGESKGKPGVDVKGKKLQGKNGVNPYKAGAGVAPARSGGNLVYTAKIPGLLIKRGMEYRVVDIPKPAPPPEEKKATAEFSLEISGDKLTATLKVRSPGGPCHPLDLSSMVAWLKQKGIKNGVKASALQDLADRFNADGQATGAEVAYGIAAEPGRDAVIEVLAKVVEESVFVGENPHLPIPAGPAKRLLTLVKAGDAVVRVTPETRGKPGTGVEGSVLPATDGVSRFKPLLGLLPKRQGSVTDFLARTDGLLVQDGDAFAVHEYNRASLAVKIIDNGFQAVLEMGPGPGLWIKPTVPEVHEAVKKAGVTYGIDWDRIDKEVAAFQEKPGPRTFPIAAGEKPEHGKDGAITFHLELDLRPVMTPDPNGRIDYRFQRNFITVEEKQPIATITPPSQGLKPGVTVEGKNVLPEDGKPVFMNALDGVVETPRGGDRFFEAAFPGELMVDEKRGEMKVARVKVVDAVDMALGHLTFTGNVTVKQNIEDGMKVDVKGELLVKGMILGAMVEVDGNVACEGGIITKETGYVLSTREVRARFIENSTVKAMGSVKVERAILQSRVYSLETIESVSPKSFVIGGVLVARVGATLRHLGNAGGSRSLVHLGADYRDLENYLDLTGKIKFLAAEAGRIDQDSARLLRPVMGKWERLGPEGKLEYRQLLTRKAEIVRDFRARREECQKFLARIEAVGAAELTVLGYAFADNTIRFGSVRRLTAGQLQNVRFTYDAENRLIQISQGGRAAAGSGKADSARGEDDVKEEKPRPE